MGNSVLGTSAYFGGFDAVGALGSEASLSTLGGAGLEGAAALGPAALLAGAGLAGLATGHYLYENTEVGEDSQDALGGIDSLMGGTPGHSKLVAMDDRRQELWDKGGAWNDTKSIGYGIGEAGIATAGAVGGLAKGAYHGVRGGASWLWDHTFGDSGPSDEEMAANQQKADTVISQIMDDQTNADMDSELNENVHYSQTAHEEMPPLPAPGR